MKTIIIKLLLLIIICSAFFIIHEKTHQIINYYYGCYFNEIIFFKEGALIGNKFLCGNANSDILLAHSINEIVGYTVMPLLLGIFGLIYIKE